jgi:hypothetical protein
MKCIADRVPAALLAAAFGLFSAQSAAGYSFNQIVPDVRQPASISGGSACPVPAHIRALPQSRAFQWSTTLSVSPLTVITQNNSGDARLAEIEQAISASLAAWTAVPGSTLQSIPASVSRTAPQNVCAADGLNSICFDQADSAFTPGVLAFTRVITADRAGESIGTSSPSSAPGEILDADIYFNPSDSFVSFATPPALASNPKSYDLASILTHELGHTLGFSHSAVWNAMMFPYAPAPGSFAGARPTPQRPDAQLGDDDRTGLRVLYPDPANSSRSGAIAGRILPANPLSLPVAPFGITGIFGAQVVALDAASGAVIAAVVAGASCAAPGPARFDGSYSLERLPLGRAYLVYAEPLNGAVTPPQLGAAIAALCRNSGTDGGWPDAASCTVPPVDVSFTTRLAPGP